MPKKSKIYTEFYDYYIKILVFYDLKTMSLKDRLNTKINNYKEKLLNALESNQEIINLQLEDDGEVFELSRKDAKAFYELAKLQTYDNLIKFENKILLLFLYSEIEQYLFKTFKYILKNNPEILEEKTIMLSKLLNKNLKLEQIIEEKIDFVLNELFYEKFENILKYAKKPLGIIHNVSQAEIIELDKIRLIRNLYTHNDGIVNTIFLSKLPSCTKSLNESYSITRAEINSMENILISILEKFDKSLIKKHPELVS